MAIEPNNHLSEKLKNLASDHAKLLELIAYEKKQKLPNELSIHKMKKQLEVLKAHIGEIKSKQYPDIIA